MTQSGEGPPEKGRGTPDASDTSSAHDAPKSRGRRRRRRRPRGGAKRNLAQGTSSSERQEVSASQNSAHSRAGSGQSENKKDIGSEEAPVSAQKSRRSRGIKRRNRDQKILNSDQSSDEQINARSANGATPSLKAKKAAGRRGRRRRKAAQQAMHLDQDATIKVAKTIDAERSIEDATTNKQEEQKNKSKHRPSNSIEGQRAQTKNRARHRQDIRAYDGQNLYAALDLGTNNCRLLVARPENRGFRVVDAYSRIVRLGEGIEANQRLSDAAMTRAIEALKHCRYKLDQNGVKRARLIATEACRAADNGAEFIDQVRLKTGLSLEIVNRETEARLAVAGCASLVDHNADGVILFDIGGGSSEIVWLDLRNRGRARGIALTQFIRSWISLPIGVVNLAERHGGVHVTPEIFDAMVEDATTHLANFHLADELEQAVLNGNVHMLGTSGTVTTLAGVHLGLKRYDRRRVDGAWLGERDVTQMIDQIKLMPYENRVENPCIGADRADLVLAGCAILAAIKNRWNCSRLRVADRGLREGILTEMMSDDGVWRSSNRNSAMGRRR